MQLYKSNDHTAACQFSCQSKPGATSSEKSRSFSSFHRRSASVCSLSDRFSDRKDALVWESRSNPYIGYFLQHGPPGCTRSSFLLPVSGKRAHSGRHLRPPPAIKTSLSISTASGSSAVSSPSIRSVRFSNNVRRSSLVMTHWDGEQNGQEEEVLLSLTNRKKKVY